MFHGDLDFERIGVPAQKIWALILQLLRGNLSIPGDMKAYVGEDHKIKKVCVLAPTKESIAMFKSCGASL